MERITKKINIRKVPALLRQGRSFVTWRYGKKRTNEKRAKIPYNPLTLETADSADPETWGTLEQALAALKKEQFDGIGVMLGDGWAGIDLDDCIEERGKIAPWALTVMQRFPFWYWEISPSGTGLHGIGRGHLPTNARNREGQIEVYDCDRYFTLTGNAINDGFTLRDCSQELAKWHKEIFPPVSTQEETPIPATPSISKRSDTEILRQASKAKNGEKFTRLYRDGDTRGYTSHSEADLALSSILVFWTAGDLIQADRLFCRSALYRPKWEERHGKQTYGQKTLAKAWAGSIYAKLAKLRDAMASKQWQGLTGNTDFNVLSVLLAQAAQNGTLEVKASVRFLADRASIAKRQAVQHALTRLKDAGWIVQIIHSKQRSEANTYCLTLPSSVSPGTQPVSTVGVLFTGCVLLETQDLFRARELGTTGRRLYSVLSDTPQSEAELTRASGISRATFFRKIKKMKELGLVVNVGEKWVLGPLTLEEAAKRCKSAGKDVAQRAYHKKKSADFREKKKVPIGVLVPVQLCSDEDESVPAPVWIDEECAFLDDSREFPIDDKLLDNVFDL